MGQGQMIEASVGKLCGRPLSEADLEAIRRAILEADPPLRAEVARRVCAALGWHDALGRPKLMSCRVGLLRLHRAGLIELPAARNGNGNGRGLVKQPDAWPAEQPLGGSAGQLGGLRLAPVSRQGRLAAVERADRALALPGLHAAARCATALPDRIGPRGLGRARLRGGGLEGGRARPLDRLGAPRSARPIWGACSTTPASSSCPGCR